jgi:perosamine synthetase
MLGRQEPRPYLPLQRPDLTGNELDYVLRCLKANAPSIGDFVERFEGAFSQVAQARHAVAVNNGTAAIHLTLHALGLGPGDEVIVPTFTFVATVNAVKYTGAEPVFADCDADTWVVGPRQVEPRITPRTRAIVAVHLLGGVCDLAGLRALADRHGLLLVEDCAQALGSIFSNRHVGGWGHAGSFSFHGSKTITTGEGGMIVTDDRALAGKLRRLRNHAAAPGRRYWHEEIGFNYKMPNLNAALGLAQLERLPAFVASKQRIARGYEQRLARLGVGFQGRSPGSESANWLFSLLLPAGLDRAAVLRTLEHEGVEARPVFQCLHRMPAHRWACRLPQAELIARRGISLPSYSSLAEADLDRVAAALERAFVAAGKRGTEP